MTLKPESEALLRHLAGKPGHDEVKSDFRELLVAEFDVARADIRFEQRVEVKSRIDALIGRTVFEAKRDLGIEMRDVERKMPDYLANREAETGEPFVGIASDGKRWIVFALDKGALVTVKETTLDPERGGEFIAWLDGALALKVSLAPDPTTVRIELGGDSVAFRTAERALRDAWDHLKGQPATDLKRKLWARYLQIVYGRDVENDQLWLQHTYLVIVAKCIAFAVLGVAEDEPARLMSGAALDSVGISGAVESDFFDWIVEAPEGRKLVKRVMAHVRRFRLSEVQTDVMKALYESLIDRDQRHGLGEYYTPDWLAAKMTRQVVERPLEQKVLDPACGSGAFLFHAVRRVFEEARESGLDFSIAAREACEMIAGLDVHPVAVIIARVTFLLALAPALAVRKTLLRIPVYFGESLQLAVSQHFHEKMLTIVAPPFNGEPPAQLDFPELLCRDPQVFDGAIEAMRDGAERGLSRTDIETRVRTIVEDYYHMLRMRMPTPDLRVYGQDEENAVKDMGAAYLVYRDLKLKGRDSIWPYVARNQSRPLSRSHRNWANVLIGNPPWVAFRHMNPDLQKRFRELAKSAGVYVGGKFATQNDLCALFTARAASLYLKPSGQIAFVLPFAVLSRGQFERLRSGSYLSGSIQWDEVWTMDDSVQPLFPVPACAVFGRRRATGKAMPDTVRAYSGALPLRDCPEALFDELVKSGRVTQRDGLPKPVAGKFTDGSAYRKLFRDGATLYPRMLCFVERKSVGMLGFNPMAPLVVSRRAPLDKKPWKDLPSLEHPVEAQFLRPTLLGESILPFRVFKLFEAIIPVTETGELMDAQGARARMYDRLWDWMADAERLWAHYGEAGTSFVQQLNHYGKLTAQFPLSAFRVVYSKAGIRPAAALVSDATAVIDHKLYWWAPDEAAEGAYLAAILNSETARARAEAYQSRGQWGARDFDKVMFNLPIPRFSSKLRLHRDLAASAEEAERVAAAVLLPEDVKFQRARALVREALADVGVAHRIDSLVARLLDAN